MSISAHWLTVFVERFGRGVYLVDGSGAILCGSRSHEQPQFGFDGGVAFVVDKTTGLATVSGYGTDATVFLLPHLGSFTEFVSRGSWEQGNQVPVYFLIQNCGEIAGATTYFVHTGYSRSQLCPLPLEALNRIVPVMNGTGISWVVANEAGNIVYASNEAISDAVLVSYLQFGAPLAGICGDNEVVADAVAGHTRTCTLKSAAGKHYYEAETAVWDFFDTRLTALIFRDVTAQKATYAEVQSLASFVADDPYPVVACTPEGVILFANNAAKLQLGLNQHNYKTGHPFAEGIRKNQTYRELYYVDRWYGQFIVYNYHENTFRVFSWDITEQVEAIEASRLNEEQLVAVLESLPDSIFLKDGEGRWQIINNAATNLFRLHRLAWKNKNDTELSEANLEFREAHLICARTDAAAWERGVPTKGMEVLPGDGSGPTYLDVIKVPLFHFDGTRKALVVLARDITERKKREKEQKADQQIQEQLNAILKLSLATGSTAEICGKVVDRMLTSNFTNMLRKVAIFIENPQNKKLELLAAENLNSELLNLCNGAELPLALFTRTTEQRKTVFSETLPGLIEVAYYATPIIFNHEVLGFLVAFLEPNHKYNGKEVFFLESVANILAGMVNRKHAESELKAHVRYLKHLDRVNHILQKSNLIDPKDEMARSVLEAILAIFEVDRVWVVSPVQENSDIWRVEQELIAGSCNAPSSLGMQMPRYAGWRDSLTDPEPLELVESQLEDFCFTGVSGLEHVSVTLVPMLPQSGLPAVLALISESKKRDWLEEEKNLLREIAHRFSMKLNTFVLLGELKKNEAKYRFVTETAHDVIVSYTLDGDLTFVNKQGLEFFGLTESNYRTRKVFEFVPAEEMETVAGVFSSLKQQILPPRLIALKLYGKNNNVIPCEVNSTLVRLGSGDPGLISVIRDITVRKLAEEKLLLHNEELQAINTELDSFVYSTSHDLRAPLNSVMGLINLARLEHSDVDGLNDYLDLMEQSVSRLDNVIRSIIDYSRNKKSKFVFEHLNMEEIYLNIVDSVSFTKGSERVQKISEFRNNHPFASDKVRINTIVSNLVTNAIKYSRPDVDSYVKFTFEADHNHAIITVEDNGEGIPENKLGQVFEMFYRNSVAAEGTGLGLYIVKQNVNRLNGVVELKSAPGHGSKFTVRIPNMVQTIADLKLPE